MEGKPDLLFLVWLTFLWKLLAIDRFSLPLNLKLIEVKSGKTRRFIKSENTYGREY